MTTALTARNAIADLLESTFTELAGKVEKGKRDMIEKWPCASVYVGQIQSEPIATRGHVERTVSIEVELHRKSENVEEVLLINAETLEAAVYASRNTISPNIKRIYLSDANVQKDPQQKGLATLNITFSITISASLTA